MPSSSSVSGRRHCCLRWFHLISSRCVLYILQDEGNRAHRKWVRMSKKNPKTSFIITLIYLTTKKLRLILSNQRIYLQEKWERKEGKPQIYFGNSQLCFPLVEWAGHQQRATWNVLPMGSRLESSKKAIWLFMDSPEDLGNLTLSNVY